LLNSYLRTKDLAQSVGLSVQQIRNYEAWGFIPPVQRSKNGYRLYMVKHLKALQTSRSLINGYGWQQALKMMHALHQGDLSTALALVDIQHSELARKRIQIECNLQTLRLLQLQSCTWTKPCQSKNLRIGEAAKHVNARVSALYFWEQQGLLLPARDKNNGYRTYDQHQIQRLQIIVLLKEIGCGIDVMRLALEEITSGDLEKAIETIERRGEQFTKMSWARIDALSSLRSYISDIYPEILDTLVSKQ